MSSVGDAQPKPTASHLLHAHMPEDPSYDVCICGAWNTEVGGVLGARQLAFAQHQEDVLRAAGLLATAEPHPVVDPMLRPGQAVAFVRWLAEHDRDIHREGYRTALDDVRSGAFISGPVYDALAEHDRQVLRDAALPWLSEQPPGKGVDDWGRGWLACRDAMVYDIGTTQPDRIEHGERA